jgi:hypothetical protein
MAARRPARLVAVLLTSEGDPFTETLEALGDGTARVTTDTTCDRFAGDGAGVQVETCSGPQPSGGSLMFDTCSVTEPSR